MKLDEFRSQMEYYRRRIDEEARSLKDSYLALDRLHTLYQGFDAADRAMADQVLAEWALSGDEKARFDALALIDEFNIVSALPALRALASRLATSDGPASRYELKKVERITQRLGSLPSGRPSA